MCRITGFVDANSNRDYDMAAVLVAMRDSLQHGGPDDAGAMVDQSQGVALGHRRLSIIDLTMLGHQPMVFDNLTIAYNGEVYNHSEIRRELEECGYSFVSTSDTEVVLKAFHKWGQEAVLRFRGMWGFAIWDSKTRRLTLCRDRFGVKPLYWSWINGLFLFGSELKSLLKHPRFEKQLSNQGLGYFLQYGYIPAPHTIYDRVYKLEPGYFLTFNGKEPQKQKYWEIRDQFSDTEATRRVAAMDEKDVLDELECQLTESFKLRMVADVPVGVFLSGGVDSSLLTALLQREYAKPLKTFTIGFREPAFDEADYAREVAKILGTEHNEYYCTADEAFTVIEKYPEIYDEPMADPSGIPTYLVSRLAHEQVKVSLSADGADEQFGGYGSYLMAAKQFNFLGRGPFNLIAKPILSLLTRDMARPWFGKNGPLTCYSMRCKDKFRKLRNVLEHDTALHRHEAMEKHIDCREVAALKTDQSACFDRLAQYPDSYFDGLDRYSQMFMDDLCVYLPDDMLAKVDRASMAVSLESREPFLDYKLVQYSARLPVNYKIRNNTRKYALRRILSKYVPERIFNRPKLGFEIPLYDWFRSDLNRLFDHYLDATLLATGGVFNADAVSGLQRASKAGSKAATHKLWMLLVFQMWHERWM